MSLSPCGQVMDVMRSCYTCLMRLQEGADPVAVTWQFAQRGANLIGVPTPFASSGWEIGDDLRFASYLGEQAGPRPWQNGLGPGGNAGKRLCFPLDYFRSGVPAGVAIDIPVDRSELPLCCQDTSDGIGGALVNGTGAVPPPPPFNCLTLPDSLSCNVTSVGAGCAGLTQAIALIRSDPMTCTWFGTLVTWLGNAAVTLNYSAGVWTMTIDCFTGNPTIAFVSFTQVPFQVVFSVTDTAACCSFSGTDAFQVVIS